jgi:diguanylate cyclase (GGDEF)-like protein/PAS domain S-box-containing protein
MTSRTWTQRELEEFVHGRVVSLFSNGGFVEIPALLVAAGAVPGEYRDTMEVTNRIHPDDRAAMADMSIAAINNPGVPAGSTYRFCRSDGWMRARSEMVYIADEPINGLLTGTVFEPLTDEDDEAVGPWPERAGGGGSVHWMLFTMARTTMVLSAEGAVEQMLGRHPSTVVGRNFREFLHRDSYGDVFTSWMEMLTKPESTRVSRRCFVRPDGTELWVETAFVSRLGDNGEGDVLLFAVDITERMAQEEELRRTQEELRLLAEQVPAAVFRADENGRITFTNHRWHDLLGELADARRLSDLACTDDRARIDTALQSTDAGGQRLEFTSNCGRRWLAINLREVHDLVTGRTTFVGSVDDETVTSALRHQADHDDLTGLLSRRAFEERVGHQLDTAPGRGAVGFIDLDRFKDVNDRHGHEVGDAVLATIARRLGHTLRESDHVGRYGGDEFVVFCPDTDDPGLVAARIRRVCDEPVTFDGGTWAPSASIGVALAEPGETVSDLVRRADQAMFSIKRAQRLDLPRRDRSVSPRGA